MAKVSKTSKKTRSPSRSSATNPVTQVAGRIGGITVAAIALIMLFGEGYRWVAFPVTGCLVILGIFLGYYASK